MNTQKVWPRSSVIGLGLCGVSHFHAFEGRLLVRMLGFRKALDEEFEKWWRERIQLAREYSKIGERPLVEKVLERIFGFDEVTGAFLEIKCMVVQCRWHGIRIPHVLPAAVPIQRRKTFLKKWKGLRRREEAARKHWWYGQNMILLRVLKRRSCQQWEN